MLAPVRRGLADHAWRRTALIEKLFAHSTGYGLFKNDKLNAFALCRSFGRGHVVGPVMAESDADAVAVVRPHLADHSGSFLRVDTHMHNGEFAAFLSHAGMPVFDTVLTMSLGKRLADFANGGSPRIHALASQTLGKSPSFAPWLRAGVVVFGRELRLAQP